MAESVFWSALLVVAYVYVGYPLALLIWSRVAPRPVRKRDIEPAVSLVIAMHNERDNVTRRMRDCAELDYPASKLQVVVSLDAPTDGTAELLEPWKTSGVTVVESAVRAGKAVAVNNGIAAAAGEIVLLTDARQRFEPDVIRKLVANFADESVGAVSGELVLLDKEGNEAADTVGMYWRYEKALRFMESAIHSVPGGTGSIIAIRRELFTPLPAGTVLDDVLTPMRIVLGGKRAVFEPAARAYDAANLNLALEYARKKRTLMGNYEIFAAMPELLAPWRNPIAWQMASHKAGRLVVPWCLAALIAANLFLRHGIWLWVLAAQIAFYALALMGRFFPVRAARVAYTFVLLNWAAVAGLYHFVRGHEAFWNVSRSEEMKCQA
ncbi:MAG TPA: glycosyltransferase family 2 protein [Bryobacteraceae bacterium]|jgi:cellulose synthase/poly-beta-1,6-N-acetylglucosamine synthase-like glycosyltransferase|nr:glycosyltransferase family 2 protein [Bryobacteraceae bacterium]